MDPMTAPRSNGPELRLALLGAGLVAACLGLALVGPFAARPGPALALMAGAGLLWLLALVVGRRATPGWGLLLGVALAMRVLLAGSGLELSDDLWRNGWEGGLVLEGKSPYAWAPDAPELAAERDAWAAVHGRMNNTAISAAYPPVTQAASALLTVLAGGPEDPERLRLALRLGFGLADLAVLAALARLLARRGRPRGLMLAWAWCPLVAWEFFGAAHFDALGIALLVAGLAALEPRTPRVVPGGAPEPAGGRDPGRTAVALGGLALAAAVHVKLLPLLALPFVLARELRRGPARAALLAGALALGLVLPVAWVASLDGGLGGLGAGLSAYGLRWESWNLVFGHLQPLFAGLGPFDGGPTDPRVAARLLVGALELLLVVALLHRRVPPVPATAVALCGYLLLTPTLHPWYLAWGLALLPALPLALARPWLLLVAASPLLYLPVVPWQTRGVWEVPAWTWPVVGLPVLVLLVAGVVTTWRRDRAGRAPGDLAG